MPFDLAAIKHAPRWSIYAVGGVAAGGIALKLYKNRTTSTATADANTASTPDVASLNSTPTLGTQAPGVIVPPTIIQAAPVDQSGTGLGALQTLYMGGVQSLFDAFNNVQTNLFASNSQLQSQGADITSSLLGITSNTVAAQQTALLAGAGSAPAPAAVNPTPVVADVPIPAPAPAPVPVAITPAPAPAPVAAPAPADPCPGTAFPFAGPHGCYKVVCASGAGIAKGRWHFYANGIQEHISSVC